MNAHLAEHIPSVPICVIYQTNPSVVTQVFTTVLARNVPQFAEQVRRTRPPIDDLDQRSTHSRSQITPGMQVTFPNLHSCSIGIDGSSPAHTTHAPPHTHHRTSHTTASELIERGA
jgi:hypothetical protein